MIFKFLFLLRIEIQEKSEKKMAQDPGDPAPILILIFFSIVCLGITAKVW